MPVIVGLGNPGSKYAGTRHNIGYELIDRLAAAFSIKLGPGKGLFYIGDTRFNGEKLVLVKPTTYMNRSGDAVVQVLNWFKIHPDDCLICYDDLNLPVGTIRLRGKGSAGGHNGMKDIIQKIGSNDFPRLRIGIGNDFPEGRQADYVLSAFTPDERKIMELTLEKSADAVRTYITHGMEEAMNQFNQNQ